MNLICIFLFTIFCGAFGKRQVDVSGDENADNSRGVEDTLIRFPSNPLQKEVIRLRAADNLRPELTPDFLCKADDSFYIECNECHCLFGIVECTKKSCGPDDVIRGPKCSGNDQWIQIGVPDEPLCQWCNCIDGEPLCPRISCPEFLNIEEEMEEKPLKEEPLEETPFEEKPSVEKPSQEKPSEEKRFDEKPIEEELSQEKPSEEKPFEEKPIEEEPFVEKPMVEKPSEEKPSEQKPSEQGFFRMAYNYGRRALDRLSEFILG